MDQSKSTYQPSKIITISPEQSGQRIDNFLFNQFKRIPKTRIYKMLRKGEVRVNKGRIKPTYKIRTGDSIRLPPVKMPEKITTVSASLDKVQQLENRIIYESERLLILNKPSGMAVHGGSGDSFGVIESLRSLRPSAPYLELVHRLDKHTSGCLMIAKRRSTLRHLHELLRQHKIEKTYHCWVHGQWPDATPFVNEPLEVRRFANGDRRTVVSIDGKPSKTLFRQLQFDSGYTLLEAKPLSGRMHQIRVHCAHLGHAICGDEKYVNETKRAQKFKRLYLHAAELSLQERPDTKFQHIKCHSNSFASFPN